MMFSNETVLWVKIGDVILNANEVVGVIQDGKNLEVMFKNGNTVQIDDYTVDEFWGKVIKKR